MRQQRIHWDAENTRHILVERAERKISKAEIEEVLLSGDTFRAPSHRGGGRFLATGYTSTGRQLLVVFKRSRRHETGDGLGRRRPATEEAAVMERMCRPLKGLTDDELRAIIAPVEDRDYTEWNEDQIQAEMELAVREHHSGEGQRIETMAEAARHGPGTVPISIRMPIELLDRVRVEARRRNTPYQRLIRELVEAGLAANAQPLARLEISAELLGRIASEKAVIVEVRRSA